MISNAKAFNFQNQRLWLLPGKAIYWQKRKILMLADLHIGKSSHFRKNGIAVPDQINRTNLQQLESLLDKAPVQHLIILGDLFHSNINREWQQFTHWRKKHNELEVSLVVGNHDILEKQNYHTGRINLFKKMKVGPFLLVHDIEELEPETNDSYILSGHIHPAVKLVGKGRQAMKLPCFYFGEHYGVLPAFGAFTGTHAIEPKDSDRVFIIVNGQIMAAHQLST